MFSGMKTIKGNLFAFFPKRLWTTLLKGIFVDLWQFIRFPRCGIFFARNYS